MCKGQGGVQGVGWAEERERGEGGCARGMEVCKRWGCARGTEVCEGWGCAKEREVCE